MANSKKVVIVTGVTGQDGSFMVDYLLEHTDYEIYGTVRRLSVKNHDNIKHIDNPRFKLINFDLSDSQSINYQISNLKPDYFINFAAQSFVGSSWEMPKQTFSVNANAVLDILEAIRQFAPHCRFYNAGTSEEFGDVSYSPQDEKHPLRPRSPYGAAKAAARHLVKVYRESYGIYAVQGWLFNHEGTRRGEEFVTRKITKAVSQIYVNMIQGKEWTPIELGNMGSKRDWSDAEDFVEGVWMMLNQDVHDSSVKALIEQRPWVKGFVLPEAANKAKDKYLSGIVGEYILSSGETHTIAEFVEKAFEHANIDAELRFDKDNDWSTAKFYVRGTNKLLVKVNEKFFRPAEVELLWGDSTLARSKLGWTPKITFDELIKKMVEHDIIKLRNETSI